MRPPKPGGEFSGSWWIIENKWTIYITILTGRATMVSFHVTVMSLDTIDEGSMVSLSFKSISKMINLRMKTIKFFETTRAGPHSKKTWLHIFSQLCFLFFSFHPIVWMQDSFTFFSNYCFLYANDDMMLSRHSVFWAENFNICAVSFAA